MIAASLPFKVCFGLSQHYFNAIEFLRFLYLKEAKLNVDLALELLHFTDKYLQDDLMETCLKFLRSKITSKTVNKIADFVRARNIHHLDSECRYFLTGQTGVNDAPKMIAYLEKQYDPEFTRYDVEIKNRAIGLISLDFKDVCKAPEKNKEIITLYGEFLLKNIEIGTIGALSEFLTTEMKCTSTFPADSTKPRSIRTKLLLDLKRNILDFVHKNYKEIQEKRISARFDNIFFTKLVSHIIKASSTQPEQKIIEET